MANSDSAIISEQICSSLLMSRFLNEDQDSYTNGNYEQVMLDEFIIEFELLNISKLKEFLRRRRKTNNLVPKENSEMQLEFLHLYKMSIMQRRRGGGESKDEEEKEKEEEEEDEEEEEKEERKTKKWRKKREKKMKK
ncbi:uncharacterized protein [Ranitomeya imitator]|uniref:uncharacterized protein n=1 Tax=Ranitomeya imitator TaxID=111125 RepID=UPI0037E70B50